MVGKICKHHCSWCHYRLDWHLINTISLGGVSNYLQYSLPITETHADILGTIKTTNSTFIFMFRENLSIWAPFLILPLFSSKVYRAFNIIKLYNIKNNICEITIKSYAFTGVCAYQNRNHQHMRFILANNIILGLYFKNSCNKSPKCLSHTGRYFATNLWQYRGQWWQNR